MSGPVRRVPDWPERLARLMAEAERRPFRWGEHDCCRFAANAVRAVTGRDVLAGLGRYASARGAVRRLRRLAGGSVIAATETIARANGFSEVPVRAARRGDVVLFTAAPFVAAPFDGVLGVCDGAAVVLLTPDGAMRLPLPAAAGVPGTRAFRV